MGQVTYDESPIVSVPCGENAWGSLTSLYTSKIPWKGFRVISQSQNAGNTSFIQLYVGSNPYGPILVSDGQPDDCWDYFVPGNFPAGTSFSAEVYYNTTSGNNCNIGLIGLSEPDIDCVQMISLGVTAGTATVSCPANSWTSLGNFPSLPVKAVRFGFSNNTGTGSGQTISASFGPSSSSLTPLWTFQFGNAGTEYGWLRKVLKLGDLLSGNQLWMNPTQGCGVHAYLYI